MKFNLKTNLLLAGACLTGLFATATARADYSSTILAQNPAGYYPLNETVNPAYFGVTNSGSLGAAAVTFYTNLPTLNLAGPLPGSSAVGLDGASQYIDTPWVTGLNTSNFTFEIWANAAVVPKFAYLASAVNVNSPRSGWYLAQDDGSTFSLGSAYVLRMFNQNTTTPSVTLSAKVPPAGTWDHIVITFDGTNACMYTNGVLAQSAIPTASSGKRYVPDDNQPLTVGCRSSLNFFWPGAVANTAMYGSALSAARVAAHYASASQSAYAAAVSADAPLLFDQYIAPPQPAAYNFGSTGRAGNGLYLADATTGAPGPQPPTEPGFSPTNTAAAFDAGGGSVLLPPFNFNTNTVTISGWVNATNAQQVAAGIVVCDGGGTYAGLTIDGVNGGLGLGYVWNNDALTYNWSPSADAGLPQLPDSQWAYVALVVQPTEADLYLATADGTFSSVTNYFNHINQSFASSTTIGTDAGQTVYSFNGAIDHVAIWNRSLSSGELYTQFGAALGNLPPQVFTSPASPSQSIVQGDTLVLSANVGGTPDLSYQWYSNSVAIFGATNLVYTKPNFDINGDSGTYYIVATNPYGTATSGTATVTGQLATAPAIVSAPTPGTYTVYPGGTLNWQVAATGGGLKFQWKKNGTNVVGATTPTYLVGSVTNVNAGTYTLSVTNKLGSVTVGPFVVVVPSLAAGTYAQVVDADAPVSWWRLDETAATNGTILADAMGRHSGTYTNIGGLTLGVAGAIASALGGTAATFNGDGSYASVPYFSELSNTRLTLEVWAKQSTVTSGTVVSSSDGTPNEYGVTATTYWQGETQQKVFGQSLGNGNAGYDPTIYKNQWTHIVIEYGGTGNPSFPWQIWINGVTDGYIWGGGGLNTSQPFIIGGRGTGAAGVLTRFFSGSVDEVAFYKTNLTTAQIQNHYAAAFFGVPPSFSVQPAEQNRFPGQSVSFSTAVAGAPTIGLQWRVNGVAIPGQTNTTLTLTNLLLSQSGNVYTILATNKFGSLLSSNATLTVYTPPTAVNLTNALVLHLTLNGTYADASGRNNNATAVGNPSFVPGLFGGQAVNVFTDTTNGNYNYLTLGTPADLLFSSNVDFSVSYWVQIPTNTSVYSDAAQTNPVPGDLPFLCSAVGSTYNPGLTLAPTYKTGGIAWSLENAATNGTSYQGTANTFNDGNWHNVVEVFARAGNCTTYLDGLPVNSTSIAGIGDVDSGQPFMIGQDPSGFYTESGGFNLADMGLWRRALTDLEARTIYYAAEKYGKSFTAGPLTLSLTPLADGSLQIAWPSGTLYQSATLNGTWTPVPGATPPYYTVTPASTGNMFFRVQQ